MNEKEIEGLICPACSTPIDEEVLKDELVCPKCRKNLKQRKYLAFLEFLMMQGIVTNIDFFDPKLYGEEIKKVAEADELKDETDPEEYENLQQKFEQYEDDMEMETAEEEDVSSDEWEEMEEDWMAFNRKQMQKDLRKEK
ncbi:MAG: hypothetical protein H8D46_02020 [FCB group bacterium]|nr:hypothetical protein [FCB group bacterium]